MEISGVTKIKRVNFLGNFSLATFSMLTTIIRYDNQGSNRVYLSHIHCANTDLNNGIHVLGTFTSKQNRPKEPNRFLTVQNGLRST